jgi:hypothetical protein
MGIFTCPRSSVKSGTLVKVSIIRAAPEARRIKHEKRIARVRRLSFSIVFKFVGFETKYYLIRIFFFGEKAIYGC